MPPLIDDVRRLVEQMPRKGARLSLVDLVVVDLVSSATDRSCRGEARPQGSFDIAEQSSLPLRSRSPADRSRESTAIRHSSSSLP